MLFIIQNVHLVYFVDRSLSLSLVSSVSAYTQKRNRLVLLLDLFTKNLNSSPIDMCTEK